MTRPTDAVQSAVRRMLREAGGNGSLALVACSGGPDSLALAAATGRVAAGVEWRAGALVVDHQLQSGSDQVAAAAAETCRALGLDPVILRQVEVAAGPGPEAAARAARYRAFSAAAAATGARALLLGHTLDDQAETVLLGLARGSGARSLQGMPARAPLPAGDGAELLRPLLRLRRETVALAGERWGLTPWVDPHNSDPSYRRVRIRDAALPALVAALGPGVPLALARTADQLRDDEDVLQALVRDAMRDLPAPIDCTALAGQPAAIRRRVLREVALQQGCPPAALTSGHLYALDALVCSGRDGGEVRLPGKRRGTVRCGRLEVDTPAAVQE